MPHSLTNPSQDLQMPAPSVADDAPADVLAADIQRGDRRALARAVTVLEQGAAAALIAALGPALGRARVIGITGPPGAGKSTLVNALIAHWRLAGLRVGVIAVDPSSPVSGGAILGDRVRMPAALDDDGVYVRSLAAQGHLGGLSPAAVRVVDALDAAGFETIVIETVGTGQNEIDIAEIADARVVVAAPGLGDGIQAMKAGLLEIADVLVVNKADRPGAAETRAQLAAAMHLQTGRAAVPVLETSAIAGLGVADLAGAIEDVLAPVMQRPAIDRRRRRVRYLIARAAVAAARARVNAMPSAIMTELVDRVLAGEASPAEAGDLILAHAGSPAASP